MDGHLVRVRGLLGLKRQYWFHLDEDSATLSYAVDQEHIIDPLKLMFLQSATVQQDGKKITVNSELQGKWILKAQTNEEATSWVDKIRSVIDVRNSGSTKWYEEQSEEKSSDEGTWQSSETSESDNTETDTSMGRSGSLRCYLEPMMMGNHDLLNAEMANMMLKKGEHVKKKPRCKLYVVSIDFGTTYSGYAFQYIGDFKRDPLSRIHTETWSTGSTLSEKTPTSLLLDPEGKFHSFGYEAESDYLKLLEDDEADGWKFFKQFKMKIFQSTGLQREFQILDGQGNYAPARNIFAYSIEYLKGQAFDRIQKSQPDVAHEDIYYVVTVPAIWSDGSRQFMIEAIQLAGIDADQAILANEPEAAALYCKERQLDIHGRNKEISGNKGSFKFEPGSKFIVLDLGGGTTDIAVYEVSDDKRLKMLRESSGGPWGGTNIDQTFLSMIEEMHGPRQFKELKEKYREEYMDLLADWEVKKRSSTISGKVFSTKLPSVFVPKNAGEDINTSKGTLRVRGDKLRTPVETMKEVYGDTIESIADHVKQIAEDAGMEGVNTVFMVGGLSNNILVQEAIKAAIPNKTVIIPTSPTLAVLLGAVIYGFCPDIVGKRISSYHYGVEEENGKFKVLVKKGQEIDISERIVEYKTIAKSTERGFIFTLYASSESRAPTDTVYCQKLGEIAIKMTGRFGTVEREIILAILFDHTEIKFEAIDAKTQRVFCTTCDLLR